MVYSGAVYSGAGGGISSIGNSPTHDAGEFIEAGLLYDDGTNQMFLFEVPAALAGTLDVDEKPLAEGTQLGYFPSDYTVASLPLTATDLNNIYGLGAVVQGATTYLDITQMLTNAVFDVRASGTGYTYSGQPGFLRTSQTAYAHDRDLEVKLVGDALDRRTDAIWISATQFRYTGTVDPGHRFEITS